MKKIIIITGQTATGKTSLAIKKALVENGELINADSRQTYKHLDIITGKDLTDHNFHEVKKINDFNVGYYYLTSKIKDLRSKIWLYDIVDPKQYFSSFDYVSLALPLIKKILDEGKTPIIIGGTYFYIYNLLYDIDTNVPPNWELRKKLDNKTVPEMQEMLKKTNPSLFKSLNKSDRSNPRRLMRKIEISMSLQAKPKDSSRHPELVLRQAQDGEHSRTISGSGLNQMLKQVQHDIKLSQKLGINNLKVEYLGLRFKNKDSLHKAIKTRVEERLKKGAVQEVRNLLSMGYNENDPGLKTIGYKEIIKYLKTQNSQPITHNQISLEWQIHEHQYAKKQYTFMKKDPNIKWIEV